MTAPGEPAAVPSPAEMLCAHCRRPLEPATVTVAYLGNAFPVELLKCPGCGQVFIPEDLALGKMVEVEKQLEDK